MSNPTFTVFTPTFNRAHTLPRVYRSLAAQTLRDFEWLIVDDGSTDETRSQVEGWMKTADFPIRYFYQENQGKHIAHNQAIREARGLLFTVLDSDDECVPDALERFKFHWERVASLTSPKYIGVSALCMDEQGRVVGDSFPASPLDANTLELKYRYGIRGEKWGVILTAEVRQYPFPELRIRYVPESLVWSRLARGTRVRFVNEPLRIYHSTPQSIIHESDVTQLAPSAHLQHLAILNHQIDYFRYAPAEFLKSAVHYSRFSFHLHRGLWQQFSELQPRTSIWLWLLAIPAGYLVYLKDRYR